jgi:hypothetical protein
MGSPKTEFPTYFLSPKKKRGEVFLSFFFFFKKYNKNSLIMKTKNNHI